MKPNNSRNGKMAALAAALIILAAPMVAMTLPQGSEQEEAEAFSIDPTGYIMGFAMGAAAGFPVGFVVGLLTSPGGGPGGDQDAVDKAGRLAEAQKMGYASDLTRNMMLAVLPADADLWMFSTSYWQRAAEYVVAEHWALDADLDPDAALAMTGLQSSASNYLYTWSAAIENVYNSILSQPREWTGAFSSMTLSMVHDAGSVPSSIGNDGGLLSVDVAQFATPSSGKRIVYIDNEAYAGMAPGDLSQYHVLHLFGGSASIRNVTTGESYPMGHGANSLLSVTSSSGATGRLPSGLYELGLGVTYAGPIMHASDANGPDVVGGMVVSKGGEAQFYALPHTDSTVAIYNTSAAKLSNSQQLQMRMTYNGPSGQATLDMPLVGGTGGDRTDVVSAYGTLVESIGEVASRTEVAAEAMWGIFDICEESSMWISPSSITTLIPGVSMSTVEIEGAYIHGMRQIASLWQNNITALDGAQLVTNVESLGLYVYGDVYLHGQLWAKNIVFTPYITNTSQKITLGHNVWKGTGFGMVWAQVDDYGAWDGSTSLASSDVMNLSEDYELDVHRIVKSGQPVSEIDLTLHVIKKYNPGGTEPPTPPQPPRVLDATTLVMIIILLVAALIFSLWTHVPEAWPILLIAIVVALIGLLIPGTVTGWLM